MNFIIFPQLFCHQSIYLILYNSQCSTIYSKAFSISLFSIEVLTTILPAGLMSAVSNNGLRPVAIFPILHQPLLHFWYPFVISESWQRQFNTKLITISASDLLQSIPFHINPSSYSVYLFSHLRNAKNKDKDLLQSFPFYIYVLLIKEKDKENDTRASDLLQSIPFYIKFIICDICVIVLCTFCNLFFSGRSDSSSQSWSSKKTHHI